MIKYNLEKKEKIRIKGFPADLEDSLDGFGDNTDKFEVLLDPDFRTNRYIYLSYAAKDQKGRTTKIVRAVLETNLYNRSRCCLLQNLTQTSGFIMVVECSLEMMVNYILQSAKEYLRKKDEPAIPIAQNVEDRRGKIYRINSDGTIPKENPDFGDKATPGLYAIGIRAAQGLTRDLHTGKIWFSEHGTHQGDEINVLEAGANYGWPMKTTGKYRFAEFAPEPILGNRYKEPVWSWLQTVAPTGVHVYWGTEFAGWNRNLLVGGLSKGSVWRLVIEGEFVKSTEELFTDNRLRIRKVVQSPMGKLYLLSDEVNGKLIRVKNAGL